VDASFISLKILLPVIKKWFFLLSSFDKEKKKEERNDVVALIKPQFEAGKKEVSRGDGVIRDPEIHKQVLLDVLGFAQKEGFQIQGVIKSPLLGPKGNAEFLVWLGGKKIDLDINAVVSKVLESEVS
jgi:23S rRNA (cytidine1920-2'-O)/16S rRNA (cytidine1409-2'-O)-methyltransferase